MDIERALVTKIISTGQLDHAISKGVRSELFADDDCRQLFDYISNHVQTYRSTPSLAAAQHDKPDFDFELVQDPLDYLINKFAVKAKRNLAGDMLLELAKSVDDPKEGEQIDQRFLEVGRKLSTLMPTGDVSRFSDMDKRIDQYELDRKEGNKPGIKFGFPTLDEWTGGIQPHEFATVAGFSGLGKSTLLMTIAVNIWITGKTVLYIPLEMEAKAILRRMDAMVASLDYRKLKGLDLPPEKLANWRETAKRVREKGVDIPILDRVGNCTPETIYAESVRYNPDIVIVDYIGLMRSTRPGARGGQIWQTVTEITQDLKQIARVQKVPILAAAQTNRDGKDGAELHNIGSSISIVQDSDIMLGLHADEEMRNRKEMELRINKNRDGRIGKVYCIWDYDDMLFRERGKFERRGEEDSSVSAMQRINDEAKKSRKRPGS